MSAQKSIWTPANVVTCARVALVPLWLLVAELVGVPSGETLNWSAMGVFAFFLLISLTDKLDGYLARSRNETTTFGKFLDPIADKLAVVVSFCFLLEHGVVGSWVLLVVISREFLVSGLRMVVASKATTMTSICGLLFVCALPGESCAALPLALAFRLLLVVAMALTVWSGIDYFAKSWKYLVEED